MAVAPRLQPPPPGPAPEPAPDVLLELRNLRTYFHTDRGVVRAVDGVDLTARRHRTLGVVGESGCGKSVMSLSIMGLVPRPPARVEGQILLRKRDGSVVDLAALPPHGPAMRAIRGREIAMIFQEPMTSLNPVLTIERQLTEGLEIHLGLAPAAARRRRPKPRPWRNTARARKLLLS